MAHSTPRQRLQETDEEGFTLVQRRRRKAPAPPSEDSTPEHRRYKLAAYEEETAYRAIRRLEKAEPDLRVRLTVEREEIYLTPKDEASAFRLSRLSREGGPFGIALDEVDRITRGVVMRYPLSYSLDPLQEHPRVTYAKRCVRRAGHGRIELTRQVEVTFRGSVPDSLNLGFWGVFSVRRYVPEPLRCFKCQAFGHVQKHCQRSELCGVCSQRHRTSECIAALKDGVSREACCPNCGGGHHVWSRRCPERMRRLPPQAREGSCRVRREVPPPKRSLSRPANPPAAQAPVPAAPGKKRRRRRRRRTRPAPEQVVLSPAAPVVTVETSSQTENEKCNKRTQTEEEAQYLHSDNERVTFTMNYLAEFLTAMCALCQQAMHSDRTFCWPHIVAWDRIIVGNFEVPTLEDIHEYKPKSSKHLVLRDPADTRRMTRSQSSVQE